MLKEEPELVDLLATVPSPIAQEEPKLVDTPARLQLILFCLFACVCC